ncbi:hypothetical protein QU481_15585 [Crenobacter sp. SG2303]|uniref:DUF4280 domain-containing protein n=1 Tax=Crenobacter oryzisoli TaxID=3056844 RepID=A0ABT7XR78_9NEIS|nr:hypothetical protein [Crenobacter sp. SG2303]MDN0075085.1 hypothetical protein [Crenobacter sp. SG2303]MDN0076307.1 hypothetical protein [Crenobacter sp. SG2303]
MPGPLLHVGATVLCAHGGSAMPTAPNPRVMVSGQPTVTMAAPYTVAGCAFNVSGAPSPCVTGQWIVAASRVTSNGQPLVLMDSQAICAPNGTPLLPVAAQTRVIAS